MRTPRQRRLIAGAPLLHVAVTAVAAVVLVVAGVLAARDGGDDGALRIAGPPPAGSMPWFASWAGAEALARVVMFTAAALVMRWRARTADPEGAVWRWLARAATVPAVASVLGVVLAVVAAHDVAVPAGAGTALLNLGVLGACPFLYQGLIHWNRYGTLTSEPGDWLNGLGAAFTLAGLGNLALAWSDSPLLDWSAWQLQLWLVRVAAEFMIMGTAATILVIGGLLRDVRAWGVTLAVALAAGLDIAGLGDVAVASGDAGRSDLGLATLVVVLSLSALLLPQAPLARPSTSEAPTAGSFVVLLASITVLAGVGLVGDTRTSPMWWATLWAAVGALGVSLRGLHSIRLLAHLLISRHEALTDDLTGLANRRALDRRLIEDTTAGRPFTLMIIDLDGFKQINDRFGHAVGDELLRRAGHLLRREVQSPALAARLGGDEFAVVLPGHALSAAAATFAVLEKVTEAPLLIDGRRILVQGSVGIAVAEPGDTPEQVLRHADAAMYRAKHHGGARFEVHDEEAAEHSAQQARLVEELKVLLGARDARDDVAAGHLVVHYQPQLSSSGVVVGAEALVRWDNPRLGRLAPDAFLGHVEDYGLMHTLTAEVLREAVHQAARWQRDAVVAGQPAGAGLRISVNLSTTSLTHPDLLTLVDDLLSEADLAPSSLVLEITETSIMVEPEESIARLQDLARRGLGISIDDYGSGYSSLAYLNDLPACELKLDRSLTAHVTGNPRTADIVAGTVALAHRLGLRVIAEGVEDVAMLDTLHALGCDETQGFLHARPMDAGAFTAWLADRVSSAAASSGPTVVAARTAASGAGAGVGAKDRTLTGQVPSSR